MLDRAAGMATCCQLNYSETTYGSNLAIHLVFRAEACEVNRDRNPFLKRKGLYLQSYLKDQHAHQMWCGWTSVEAGEEGQWSQSALVQLLQRSSTAFQDLLPTAEAYLSFLLSLRSH